MSQADSKFKKFQPFDANYKVSFEFVPIGEAVIRLRAVSGSNESGTDKQTWHLSIDAIPQGMAGMVTSKSLHEQSWFQQSPKNYLYSTAYIHTVKDDGEVDEQYHVLVDIKKRSAWRNKHRHPKEWALTTPYPMDKLNFPFLVANDMVNYGKPRQPLTVLDGKQARNGTYKDKGIKTVSGKKLQLIEIYSEGNLLKLSLNTENSYFPEVISMDSDDGWTLNYKLKSLKWLPNP